MFSIQYTYVTCFFKFRKWFLWFEQRIASLSLFLPLSLIASHFSFCPFLPPIYQISSTHTHTLLSIDVYFSFLVFMFCGRNLSHYFDYNQIITIITMMTMLEKRRKSPFIIFISNSTLRFEKENIWTVCLLIKQKEVITTAFFSLNLCTFFVCVCFASCTFYQFLVLFFFFLKYCFNWNGINE